MDRKARSQKTERRVLQGETSVSGEQALEGVSFVEEMALLTGRGPGEDCHSDG